MVRARVITTDEEIDAALAQAQLTEPLPAADAVEFLPSLNAIQVRMNTGQRLLLPVEDLQGLATASPEQLAHCELVGMGYGISFPELDADFSVEGLLAGRYGNERWMHALDARRRAALKVA